MPRPSLDGIIKNMNGGVASTNNRPSSSLDGIKQAGSKAFSKAQLMVGLKSQDDNDDVVDDEEEDARQTDHRSQNGGGGGRGGAGGDDDSSQQQRRSGRSSGGSLLFEDAVDLLCPELTFQQRLIGFASCFTIGYLITFMSFKFFIQLIEGHPVPFAVNYTAGNVLALAASWFLCGPRRQFRNMFDDNRKLTSIVYLSCLVATLVVVFIPLPWAVRLFTLLALLITQCGASFWYSLSYVPYGRRTVTRMLKRALGLDDSSPSEGWAGIPGLGGGGAGGDGS